MTIPTLFATESWYCPNCKYEETIPRIAKPHTRFHTCPKMHFLSAPLVRVGVAAKVERKDPEGYIGDQLMTFDADGWPVQSFVTTRDEGQDCAVYPATATAHVDEIKEELGI